MPLRICCARATHRTLRHSGSTVLGALTGNSGRLGMHYHTGVGGWKPQGWGNLLSERRAHGRVHSVFLFGKGGGEGLSKHVTTSSWALRGKSCRINLFAWHNILEAQTSQEGIGGGGEEAHALPQRQQTSKPPARLPPTLVPHLLLPCTFTPLLPALLVPAIPVYTLFWDNGSSSFNSIFPPQYTFYHKTGQIGPYSYRSRNTQDMPKHYSPKLGYVDYPTYTTRPALLPDLCRILFINDTVVHLCPWALAGAVPREGGEWS